MNPVTGHLGTRVSALLDGQLPAEESERAWLHVQECHQCRDRVERETWVKRRLAGLGCTGGSPAVPDGLKGSLLGLTPVLAEAGFPAPVGLPTSRPRRVLGVAAIGGSAAGIAVMGVLALGAAPAAAPTTPSVERRAPVSQLGPVAVVREAARDALARH